MTDQTRAHAQDEKIRPVGSLDTPFEIMCEIANRAGNFADADAAEWMPGIYAIACEAVGEDPQPALKATGFDRPISEWPTRSAARSPAASEPAQRSKCPYCPAPPSQFTSLENCPGFVRCENCECEFLLVPKASAILTPAAVESAQRVQTRDAIAETIWQAEYVRATGKERNVSWDDGLSDEDRQKYLFVADAVLGAHIPAASEPAQCWAARADALEALQFLKDNDLKAEDEHDENCQTCDAIRTVEAYLRSPAEGEPVSEADICSAIDDCVPRELDLSAMRQIARVILQKFDVRPK